MVCFDEINGLVLNNVSTPFTQEKTVVFLFVCLFVCLFFQHRFCDDKFVWTCSFLFFWILFTEDGCLASSIGLSDPNIVPDSQMTASSTRQESNYRPAFGRLGDERGGGWCSQTNYSENDWLEVSLGDFYNICRVDTQGDAYGFAWTTAFKLNYSIDGIRWNAYKKDNGTQMVRLFSMILCMYLFIYLLYFSTYLKGVSSVN